MPSSAAEKLPLLHAVDLAASDDDLVKRILINRYRRLLVEAYMDDKMNEYERHRVKLCELIGKNPDSKRRRSRYTMPKILLKKISSS